MPGLVIILVGLGLGMLSGLGLSGWILHDSIGYFLLKNLDVLASSAFFGFLGAIIINGVYSLVRAQLDLKAAKVKQLEQEKQIVEAELRALQAQIEPHFLFNTLANTISLIETEPPLAVKTLESLTTLLRGTLQNTRRSDLTLANELELIRAYLDIQKIRLGDRLNYVIECEDGLAEHPLSPMLMQPIVENAVLHGIEPNAEGGVINVDIHSVQKQEEEYIVIQTQNSGAKFNQHVSKGSGCGLHNIERRLETLYQGKASLSIGELKKDAILYVNVVMTLPKQS